MRLSSVVRVGIVVAVVAVACGASSDYADAASIVVRLDQPVPISEVDALGEIGSPGLVPLLAYFYVPSDGPVTAGTFGLEHGADVGVGLVVSAFAEDGRTGIEQLVVYGIGFTPTGSDDEVEMAVRRLLDLGFTVDECSTPVARGGCWLSRPWPKER